MAGGSTEAVLLKHLHVLYNVGATGNLSDGQLLGRFATGRDGPVEESFAVLVDRHGPMVLRVCQQVLGDPHDAQDAFQATFLVLARQAGSVRNRDSVASWLYGVAHRVAQRAKADAARRRAHERRSASMAATGFIDEGDRPECWPELHEEVARLPEKYRAAIVLCYLEGMTTEAAARQLGCAQGTILSRLSRARERLRARLTRRGVAVPAGLVAAGSAPGAASAALPAELADATGRAAMLWTGRVSAGAVPPSVVTLTGTILRTLFMAKLRMAGVAILAIGVAAGCVVVFARQNPADHEPREARPAEGSRPAGVAADPARSDKEGIQGTWRVVSGQDNGRPIPEKAFGGKQIDGLKLFITGDTITFKMGDEIPAQGTYKLDPTKEPKWIDLTEKDGRPAPGIYDLRGDELTICYNEAGTERPNKFASELNSPDPRSPRSPNDVLLFLRREVPVTGPSTAHGRREDNKPRPPDPANRGEDGRHTRDGTVLILHGRSAFRLLPVRLTEWDAKLAITKDSGFDLNWDEAYEVTPDGLQLLDKYRVPGGVRITLPHFTGTATVILAPDWREVELLNREIVEHRARERQRWP